MVMNPKLHVGSIVLNVFNGDSAAAHEWAAKEFETRQKSTGAEGFDPDAYNSACIVRASLSGMNLIAANNLVKWYIETKPKEGDDKEPLSDTPTTNFEGAW